jgi:hypothetical protein
LLTYAVLARARPRSMMLYLDQQHERTTTTHTALG